LEREEEILARTRDNVQYLFNNIWELDRKVVEDAVVVKMPPVVFRLPREKVIPKKKEPTRWELYAQAKGIKKKKKSSKVYDKVAKEWKPTYGYNRGNNDDDNWVIEIPDNKDPMIDYFGEREELKKERVHKNELQRLRNIKRQTRRTDENMLDASIPLGVSKDLKDRTRHELVNQMSRARVSTASVGKFQPAIKNEKVPKNKGIKRKFEPNEAGIVNETERYKEVLDQVISKKPLVNEGQLAANSSTKNQRKSKKSTHKSTIHRQQYFQSKIKPRKLGKKMVKRKK
uniref:Ribosome biogenesis regulatory protein n=1 Tax=Enterobius vermicularis TaxID=51028 RepID=A0A0N4UXR5_ENTVE